MVAPIPSMFKYSIVRIILNSPPISIKFVSKFMICKVLYFKKQCFKVVFAFNYLMESSNACITF